MNNSDAKEIDCNKGMVIRNAFILIPTVAMIAVEARADFTAVMVM